MTRALLLRLSHMVVVLFGIVLLSFVMMDFAPGDFLTQMALNPQISPRTIAALREQYGLGLPFPEQFGRWLAALLRGNLGYSFSYHLPVSTLIAQRIPMTLLLTGTAVLLAWGAALPLAVYGARRAGGNAGPVPAFFFLPLHLLPVVFSGGLRSSPGREDRSFPHRGGPLLPAGRGRGGRPAP